MRIRPIDEIQKEIEESLREYDYLFRCAQLNCDRGYWTFGNLSVIPEMNKVTRHLKNLKLELNRSRLKEWERRAMKG